MGRIMAPKLAAVLEGITVEIRKNIPPMNRGNTMAKMNWARLRVSSSQWSLNSLRVTDAVGIAISWFAAVSGRVMERVDMTISLRVTCSAGGRNGLRPGRRNR